MNQTVYEKTNIVERYASQSHLQYPEATILEKIKPLLSQKFMLDLGVGGGRTTVHFAPLVKKYIGIDFSSSMIEACQGRFSESFPHATFQQGDARDLSDFEDNSIDFVLFSYNGIDYVNHIDRLKVLKEIYRVLKPKGIFCFSSHNILSVGYQPKAEGLKNQLIQTTFSLILRFLNGDFSKIRTKEYMVLRDSGEFFQLETYYINPDYQQKQLKEVGFTAISSYGLHQKEIEKNDTWVYFLAHKS